MSSQVLIPILILCQILLMPGDVSSKQPPSQRCTCGITKFKAKMGELIIDGLPVRNMAKYPWIATIHRVDHEPTPWGHCGASLISPTFVLTAAHCIVSPEAPVSCIKDISGKKCVIPADRLKVGLLGNNKKGPATKVDVKKVIPYPRFQKLTGKHDIALVQLKKPIKCNKFNMPICLAERDFVKEDTKLFIAGFGRINTDNMESSKMLREGTVKKVKTDHCLKPSLVKKYLFCTVGTKYSSCQGDSGTSVFVKKNKRYYALGVTSAHKSLPRCSPSSPVTFSSVAAYYKFIKYYVKDIPDIRGYGDW